MKRNLGIIIMFMAQLLKMSGVDIDVGEQDIEAIVAGIGAALTAVGVLHDIIRRYKAKKAKK